MTQTQMFFGAPLADRLLGELQSDAAAAWAKLVVLRDAGAPPAMAYAARIAELAPRANITVLIQDYPQDIAALAELIQATQGPILPMHPLPDWITSAEMTAMLGPDRDPEGLHPLHAGALALGRADIVPPTAEAAFLVAQDIAGSLEGRVAAVVGASPIVGRPLALKLIAAGATVRISQVTTQDLAAETRDADIVFAAAGQPGLIRQEHMRAGAIGIDIGITRQGGKLVGDIDALGLSGHASWLTHVPDGVGPVTVACLIRNSVRLCGRASPMA